MNNREWYSQGEIRFKRKQVIWLLRNLHDIRLGYWPSEHKETGYSGGKSKPHSHSAPYEKPVQIAADLIKRIEKTGPDGLCLLLAFSMDNSEQIIANTLKVDLKSAQRRINNALRYITGRCPKWIDCPGAGECINCQGCKKIDTCKKLPRKGRDYSSFKSHRKRRFD